MTVAAPAIGAPLARLEGREKVTGQARYAFEHPQERPAYAWIVQAPIPRGELTALDASAARGLEGVLEVLWHENAPRVAEVSDGELHVLQTPRIAYRGQAVALVVAESLEAARDGAARVELECAAEDHDVLLPPGHPRLYAPEQVNPRYPTDTEQGDPDGAFASAPVQVDATYTTPAEHNNPLEPHTSVARWDEAGLTVYESSQGAPSARDTLAQVFELPPEQVHVISHHVGGGFGSKGTPRPQMVLAAMAAKATRRAVKLAVSRQQMFAFVGYRTPTIQRMRLGADRDGRLRALLHDVEEQTSTVREFAEQTAVPSRTMYASPHRRTTHRVAALDVPTPSWMRAPGECPGMYALESAMDELAVACGLDPVELRVRNEPEVEPETGRRFSSRNLVACLREGAERFDWMDRDPEPRARREGDWLVGTGVASATYPAFRQKSEAFARAEGDGTFTVSVGGTDIGTGARTVLAQIAADALEVPVDRVHMQVGESDLSHASVAGGSSGTASWGTAVWRACEALRAGLPERTEARADTADEVAAQENLARYAFGAHFCEVRVDARTGEVRVPRMLGVFAAGRILNPTTARSQLIGGMTMGLSMALHEESVMDPRFGDYVTHDLAQYHVAAHADVQDVEAVWLDERDDRLNPMGSKGIGEIGIVGAAAAVAGAVHHATGVRVRDLPITPDKLVGHL